LPLSVLQSVKLPVPHLLQKKNPLTSGEWVWGKTLTDYCSRITRQTCRRRRTDNMSCSYTSASDAVLSSESNRTGQIGCLSNSVDSQFFVWDELRRAGRGRFISCHDPCFACSVRPPTAVAAHCIQSN
jgi:hypothetical protein